MQTKPTRPTALEEAYAAGWNDGYACIKYNTNYSRYGELRHEYTRGFEVGREIAELRNARFETNLGY